MAIAKIGEAAGQKTTGGIFAGSDEIGHKSINSADLSVRIGHFARAWPISSNIKRACSRILLSFDVCDGTEFRRAIANLRNWKGAGKRSCPGEGGANCDGLLERARFSSMRSSIFIFTTYRTQTRPFEREKTQKTKHGIEQKKKGEENHREKTHFRYSCVFFSCSLVFFGFFQSFLFYGVLVFLSSSNLSPPLGHDSLSLFLLFRFPSFLPCHGQTTFPTRG